jgi:hypothetical protein
MDGLDDRLRRQESERGHVSRPYHRKVPRIKGEHLRDPEALRDRDHGRISRSERKIGVALDL